MNFAQALSNEVNTTLTHNRAVALSTTSNLLLDFYSTIGALRMSDVDRKKRLFAGAIDVDKLLAVKTLFYGRDIREGLGERATFRELLTYAADNYPEIVMPNINLIGFYGRFDDLYSLIGTKCEAEMWKAMKAQFESDLANMKAGKPVSLLAKWIKTPDASSDKTRKLGSLTSRMLGYPNVRQFKWDLKALRKYLDIVEIKISANKIDTIVYSKVPAKAMKRYTELFRKKDLARFEQFLADVEAGKTTIKTSTLYPYDIVQSYFINGHIDKAQELQWENLPNYIEDGSNILVMADVSGSMTCCNCLPMASSVGLAMYFAERAKGIFHNKFMTFTDRPNLATITGTTLKERIASVTRHVGYDTNLEKAFDSILTAAIRYKIPVEDMPKALVVISDMEINSYCIGGSKTFYDTFYKKFTDAGYPMPNVVFWNVNSTHDVFHADSERKGVQLVSGHSASTFKNVLYSLNKTPIEAMMDVLTSERYAPITVA